MTRQTSPDRPAVVAGQFYPGRAEDLATMVRGLLPRAVRTEGRTLLAMVPHAGYVYSGKVAGQTLGRASLPQSLLLLGPNHTGRGARLAVWAEGTWQLPGGGLQVDDRLAQRLMAAEPRLLADHAAHQAEHSLEVVLPFLRAVEPETSILPVAVAETDLPTLLDVGRTVGQALRGQQVGIVVSSDMSHYVTRERAKALDSMALDRVLALDPEGLYMVVRQQGISMCGVLPMTLGLAAALEMGATRAELAAYDTSGSASGDYDQVVGYAGVLVS